MKTFHKQDGFTLIELMVVIVIIGVLIFIALPIYQGVQESARDTADAANARTLNHVTTMWSIETGNTVAGHLTQGDERQLMDRLTTEVNGLGPWLQAQPADPWGLGREYVSAMVEGQWQPLGRP